MVYEIGSEPKDWGMGDMYDKDSHIIMANKFAPYFKVTQNCIGKDIDFTKKHCVDNATYSRPSAYSSIRLIDGTTLIFRLWYGNCDLNLGNSKQLQNVCGEILVDVNGSKNPNQLGNDIFDFYLTNFGIIPGGLQADTELPFNRYCDKNIEWGAIIGSFGNGTGCTAWVLFNENMDYLKCSGLDWDGKKVRQIKSGRERPLNDYSIT